MVPEVGGEMASHVRLSIDAMREFTRRIIDSRAETVIIISPHAPLDARSFVAYSDFTIRASFANFRAPQVAIDFPLDAELLSAVSRAASEDGYALKTLEGYEIDHGTAVPLYFLQRNGWSGSVVPLGYTFLSNEDHMRFGACIRRAIDMVGRPVAFIASGDLSHRLKPTAPAGFNQDAYLFDDEDIAAIRICAPQRIIEIDQNLRRLAGECGYRSMLVALGVAEELPLHCEVLHYEAPFGVGYLVAQIV